MALLVLLVPSVLLAALLVWGGVGGLDTTGGGGGELETAEMLMVWLLNLMFQSVTGRQPMLDEGNR